MNGPQDVGGRDGFGAVVPESDGQGPFHADWEKRALAVTLAAGALGRWSLDAARAAREDRPPMDYYGSSYFEIWIKALERLLVAHGLVSADELAQGRPLPSGPTPDLTPLAASQVAPALRRGGPADRDPGDTRPAFAVGDPVRTLNHQPRHHTRLPAYAREKVGTVEAVRGFHVYPDDSARGVETAGWLYTVTFEAATLWGDRADPASRVSIDAWEAYLTHA